MEAIEFNAVINSDQTIAIPEQLRRRIRRKRVRVIVMEDETYVFDRDEIYDRELDRKENYIKFRFANPFDVDKSIPLLTRDEIHDRQL